MQKKLHEKKEEEKWLVWSTILSRHSRKINRIVESNKARPCEKVETSFAKDKTGDHEQDDAENKINISG